MNNYTCMPPFSLCFIDSLKDLLIRDQVWLPPSCQIVFLCGKRLEERPCARAVLLDYARKHITQSHFFLAEDVFTALRDVGKSLDLLTIESHLARCADSVIIILESDGAKVELGAFAHDKDLVKIILAINDSRFRDRDSFISEGPLKKLDANSTLGPTLYTRFESISRVHHLIEERLQKIRRKRRIRLEVSDASTFQKLSGKSRVFLLADLIWLLSPISYAELIALLANVLGKFRYDFLKFDLSLLQSLGFITTRELEPKRGYYITTSKMTAPFCEYGAADPFAVRAEAIGNYHKRARNRLTLLKERKKNA